MIRGHQLFSMSGGMRTRRRKTEANGNLIAVKTVKQQNEFILEVMDMPFGKVSRNSLSVQDDGGQNHQL